VRADKIRPGTTHTDRKCGKRKKAYHSLQINGSQRRRIFIPRRVCALIFVVDSPPPSAKLAALTGPQHGDEHRSGFCKKLRPRAENENAGSVYQTACVQYAPLWLGNRLNTRSLSLTLPLQKQQVLRAKTN